MTEGLVRLPVGVLAVTFPGAIPVLRSHGVDYTCEVLRWVEACANLARDGGPMGPLVDDLRSLAAEQQGPIDIENNVLFPRALERH